MHCKTPGLTSPPSAVPARPDWHEAALCALVGGDLWFPDRGDTPDAAKLVCQACQVRANCLASALERREPYGVWGGLTTRERLPLLARRPLVQPCGTHAAYGRHRLNGEVPCDACVIGHRAYQRDNHRARRAAA